MPEEIDVDHVPEPEAPEEGVLDPGDTYTEGPERICAAGRQGPLPDADPSGYGPDSVELPCELELPIVDQAVIDGASPEVSALANSIGYALAERGVQLNADDAVKAAERAVAHGWRRAE